MKYLQYLNDLAPGRKTYALTANPDGIDFVAYRHDTASNNGPYSAQERQINAMMRGYFLRKGFIASIWQDNPDILVPIYKNGADRQVFPHSIQAAQEAIYNNKLNIAGFRFNSHSTPKQREEAFGKLVDLFVQTSKNADLSSSNNGFAITFINDFGKEQVIYNNDGPTEITSDDIREKLDLTPEAIQERVDYRRAAFLRMISGNQK